jgi:hypothetical protein
VTSEPLGGADVARSKMFEWVTRDLPYNARRGAAPSTGPAVFSSRWPPAD